MSVYCGRPQGEVWLCTNLDADAESCFPVGDLDSPVRGCLSLRILRPGV